jgi:hypothetical protein
VKKAFHEGMGVKPTHISLYDLAEGKCLKEFDLEPHGMNIIFSIFPADLAESAHHSSVTLVAEKK